jgi:hypothetical protein
MSKINCKTLESCVECSKSACYWLGNATNSLCVNNLNEVNGRFGFILDPGQNEFCPVEKVVDVVDSGMSGSSIALIIIGRAF